MFVSLTPSVATVDANGILTGIGVGTAIVKVISTKYPSLTSTCAVTVKMRGTADFPYLIYTVQDLIHVRNLINSDDSGIYSNKVYMLMTDLDMSSEATWIPIGNEKNMFTGVFNGNGKTIVNIRIGTENSKASIMYSGFFGNIKNGEVNNLNLKWSIQNILSSSSYSGGIAGYVSGGVITNCYSTGNISSSSYSSYSGGIAGYVSGYVSVKYCLALCVSVTANGSSTSNSFPQRIAYFSSSDSSAENNFASKSMTVKNRNGSVVNFSSNIKNHGYDLIAEPIDLLNDYVSKNTQLGGIILLKWKVQSGVNNDYPVFAE